MYGLGFQHYEDVRSNVGNAMVALRPYLISRKKVVNTSMGHIAGHFLTFEIIVDIFVGTNKVKEISVVPLYCFRTILSSNKHNVHITCLSTSHIIFRIFLCRYIWCHHVISWMNCLTLLVAVHHNFNL